MERARPAEGADHAACVGLLDGALEAAAGMRGGPALVGTATSAALLERWEGREGAALYVGEYEGAVVGLVGVTAGPDEQGGGVGRRGLIECCFVEPGARGVGVGTALMEAAVQWCGQRGCDEVDALALPGDRSSKQRLEAAGFTARLLTLSRRLG